MNMKASIAFGHVLKKWRQSRKLTQAELAAACKLDRTYISMLERGTKQPTLTTILVLAKSLKLPAEELIRQTERKLKALDARRRVLSSRV